jgi:hypothetical protein
VATSGVRMTGPLSYAELAIALRREFGDADHQYDLGLLLRPSRDSLYYVRRCGRALDVTFPRDFEHALSLFDFGRLTLGPVSFGRRGDYLRELCWLNAAADFPWWGDGARPKNLLVVALSDPHAVLLDTMDGTISAYGSHDEPWTERLRVAGSFELFVRGMGTVFVERSKAPDRQTLACDMAAACGADPRSDFWMEISR